MNKLLTRNEFRDAIFKRDGYKCVICGEEGQDAHHVIERRLWTDGGYHMDNGATLCGDCHINAEKTILSVEQIREAAGIINIILPAHLYTDHKYDKWCNHILANGTRTKGELFFDESVQKVLSESLHLFTDYVKYPRTLHLPHSPGATKDDVILKDTSTFYGKEVVITEKMDGENTTMYKNHYHARSVDGNSDATQSWARNFHATIAHEIPDRWRLCGENVFAKHSIGYDNLDSYFYLFSIWNEFNECLSWDDMMIWCDVLQIHHVPVIWRGKYTTDKHIKEITESIDINTQEGIVVRLADSFAYGDFQKSVAKWVRKGHVESSHHWRSEKITKNKLK